MGKFSDAATKVQGPVVSTGRIYTHEGGIGVSRDAKSELFLLAVTNMVSEPTFYESGDERDVRFRSLVHQVAAEDPGWLGGFVPYLRDTMQMRSASLVVAAEYVAGGGPKGRGIIASALSRPDEPAEMLGYWYSVHGRKLPAAVKRGIADAAVRLYTERAVLKYDAGTRGWHMADVLETVHPKPKALWQSELFRYLLDRRHRPTEVPESLTTIAARVRLDAIPQDKRRDAMTPEILTEAGMTWEVLSSWLGAMDAFAWESVIPSMGYMALLRNLRNFEQAGVSRETIAFVRERLSDPEQVAKSRQFPLRFLSAWKATGSMTFASALEDALGYSLRNVPELGGRTLILVDCSGSMQAPISERSTLSRMETAAIFGSAIALRAEKVELFRYGTQMQEVPVQHGGSILRLAECFPANMGGTNTFGALRTAYAGQDRVIILTDEQAHDAGHYDLRDIPTIYTFNVAGYRAGHLAESGNRFTFGGLTDAAFRMLPLLERGRDADWPWVR